MNKLLAILIAIQFSSAFATPQTVDDSACAYYGADIASFATCEGNKVVKPTPEDRSDLPVGAKSNTVVEKKDAMPCETYAIAKGDAQKVVQPTPVNALPVC